MLQDPGTGVADVLLPTCCNLCCLLPSLGSSGVRLCSLVFGENLLFSLCCCHYLCFMYSHACCVGCWVIVDSVSCALAIGQILPHALQHLPKILGTPTSAELLSIQCILYIVYYTSKQLLDIFVVVSCVNLFSFWVEFLISCLNSF